MYAGSAYAAAPYAGGATTTTAPADFDSAATRHRLGGGVYVESFPPVVLPNPPIPGAPVQVDAHRYVVALVYPTPDLVAGRPT